MGIKCPKCHFDNPSDSKFCKECGTQIIPLEEIPVTETLETPTEELTRGTTFAGRYEIIEELGKGGMGKVYRVEDKKLNEEVAMKLIKPEIAMDKKTLERFSNELKLARKIVHRNVARMFDLNEEKGTHYITMEYVRGEDLKRLIRKIGQLSAGQVIPIAKQVCEGLAEAHRLGVVHRDLKPQNIMVDEDGNARIMDFGIARSIKGKGITGAGVMVGTPEYMSPEQAEVKEVDQSSDIYSLGVILYEMVTGRVPFEGETPLGIAMKHKSEMPKDPRELNTQIAEDLSKVILKCMEKDKEKRYQSAGEVRSELEKIEKGIPTTERVVPKRKPITSKEITVTFGLKKLFIPALVAAALVIAAIIIWQVLPKKVAVLIPSDKPSIAVMYFENRSGEPDLDKILVDMLTTNLSRYEGIEIVSSQRLFDILKLLGKQNVKIIDRNMATEIANRAGVKDMIMGSIIKIGNEIRIISQLINVQSGTIIDSAQVEGNQIEDIFEMADSLTEKLGFTLGLPIIDREFKIADVTTSSLDAYKYFQQGREKMWEWRLDDATRNFESAIDHDPTFALAHLYWAVARGRYGLVVRDPFYDLNSIRESITLAKKYSTRATDKEARFIDIYEAFFNRQFEKANELAEDLVTHYPNEKDATLLLGITAWHDFKFDRSIEALERTLEIDPAYTQAYLTFAYWCSRINDHQKAISAIKKHISLLPNEENPYDSAWEIYFRAGRFDDALKACEEALRINPSWESFYRLKSYIYILRGDEGKAIENINRLERHPLSLKSKLIGYFLLYKGKYREALTKLLEALKLARKEGDVFSEIHTHWDLCKIYIELSQYSNALEEISNLERVSKKFYSASFNPIPIVINFMSGILMLKKKDYLNVQAYLSKLEKLIQSESYDNLYKDYYYLLRGKLFLSQGKVEAALDDLKKISIITRHFSPLCRTFEAKCYKMTGEIEKAINSYLIFYNAIDTSLYGMGDQFYYFLDRSKFDYHMGILYEKQGQKGKAIEHYEKFLGLWKDADPGIAEVEDAKKRLAELKSQ